MALSKRTLLFFQELLERMTVTCLEPNAIEYTRLVQTAAKEIENALNAGELQKFADDLAASLHKAARPGQPLEIKTYGASLSKNGPGSSAATGV